MLVGALLCSTERCCLRSLLDKVEETMTNRNTNHSLETGLSWTASKLSVLRLLHYIFLQNCRRWKCSLFFHSSMVVMCCPPSLMKGVGMRSRLGRRPPETGRASLQRFPSKFLIWIRHQLMLTYAKSVYARSLHVCRGENTNFLRRSIESILWWKHDKRLQQVPRCLIQTSTNWSNKSWCLTATLGKYRSRIVSCCNDCGTPVV